MKPVMKQETPTYKLPDIPKHRFLSKDEMYVQEYGTKEQLRVLLSLNDNKSAKKVRDILRAAENPDYNES